jgi:hypothetical protein
MALFEITKERTIYIVLVVIAIAVLAVAIISKEMSIQVLSAKIVAAALWGGLCYAVRKWDFIGIDFTKEIEKGNIAAAIVIGSINIAAAIILSSIG